MIIRSLVFFILLFSTIFITYSIPSAMVMEKKVEQDCPGPQYVLATIDGSCWLLEYCDGVLVNKTFIDDGACQ